MGKGVEKGGKGALGGGRQLYQFVRRTLHMRHKHTQTGNFREIQ